MRTIILAVLSAACLSSSAAAATRNFGVQDFDRIRVDGPFKVKLVTNRAPFARASGDSRGIDSVAIDIQGQTLIVHSDQSDWGSGSGSTGEPVEVEIGTHDLSTATLNGAGTLKIDKVKGLKFGLTVVGSGAVQIGDANVDQLNVAVSGTSSATIGGQAKQLTATIRGISTLNAAQLSVRDATIGVEGAATVAADASNAVKISGSGPGTVTLTGRPACTLKVVGSGSVSGCR